MFGPPFARVGRNATVGIWRRNSSLGAVGIRHCAFFSLPKLGITDAHAAEVRGRKPLPIRVRMAPLRWMMALCCTSIRPME